MLKEFDPEVLGRLEVGWWKAHNAKDHSLMLELLIKQNVNLYSFTPQEARETLKFLIQATKFHDTRDWNAAVSLVGEYYRVIKTKTGLQFNPKRVAELEVGWWKLHDELEGNEDKSPLATAFVNLYSMQFGIPKDKLLKAGELKAKATHEHDLAEGPSTRPEDVETHWKKAEQLLIEFYRELRKALS